MKTKGKDMEVSFNAVKYMRNQRDRISREIMNLSPEEIVKYFERNVAISNIKPPKAE